MVDISIVDGGYKLTYNWGVPHCMQWSHILVRCWRPPSFVIIELAPNPRRVAQDKGTNWQPEKKRDWRIPAIQVGDFW